MKSPENLEIDLSPSSILKEHNLGKFGEWQGVPYKTIATAVFWKWGKDLRSLKF